MAAAAVVAARMDVVARSIAATAVAAEEAAAEADVVAEVVAAGAAEVDETSVVDMRQPRLHHWYQPAYDLNRNGEYTCKR